ncbi:MAG: chemotaxis protein CheW [Coriobacteriia bacterium]
MPRKKKEEPQAVTIEEPVVPDMVAVQMPTEAPVESLDLELPRVVTFMLADQRYAIPIESVQEIQQIVEFTPVPDVSPALVGMLDVRGLVVPAIDLRLLFGLEPKDYHLDTPMILLRSQGHLAALLVDEVEDVYEVPEGSMQAPSKLYTLADRMIGICRLAIGLVVVLDPDRLVPGTMLSAIGVSEGEGFVR